MFSAKLIIPASLLLLSTSAFTANPIPGFYLGVVGGGSYAPKSDGTLYNPYTANEDAGKFTYKLGGIGGAYLGYRCGKFLFEGEFLYNLNQFDKFEADSGQYNPESHVTPDGLKLGGETKTFAGFFNTKYEFYRQGSDTSLIPYIGIGIGVASIRTKKELYCQQTDAVGGGAAATQCQRTGTGIPPAPDANPIFFPPYVSNMSSAFAIQGIIGANYFFDDFTALGLDVRGIGSATKMGSMGNSNFELASVNLSLTFALDTFTQR